MSALQVVASSSKQMCGRMAGCHGARIIQDAIAAHGEAFVIVATGASQFDVLATLVRAPGIDWSRVTCFHLDEYVGIPSTHPASFRKYLKERFVELLPMPPKQFYYIDGEGDAVSECSRLKALITAVPRIDVAFIGIGENGHIAFNDPPADFETSEPYLVLDLDEACRMQQLGEGWFPTLEDVPSTAISMSCKQICKAQSIVCTVPDQRKANAVNATIKQTDPDPKLPASYLHTHKDCVLFVDSTSWCPMKGGWP